MSKPKRPLVSKPRKEPKNAPSSQDQEKNPKTPLRPKTKKRTEKRPLVPKPRTEPKRPLVPKTKKRTKKRPVVPNKHEQNRKTSPCPQTTKRTENVPTSQNGLKQRHTDWIAHNWLMVGQLGDSYALDLRLDLTDYLPFIPHTNPPLYRLIYHSP